MTSERDILLLCVLNQLDLPRKIDYKRLAYDIGIQSSEAARLRWFRFKAKLRDTAGTTKPVGVIKRTNSLGKQVEWTKGAARKESSEEAARADDELDEIEDVPETPMRRIPSRKARAAVFKDELSDFENEDLEVEEGCDEAAKLMEGVEGGLSSPNLGGGV